MKTRRVFTRGMTSVRAECAPKTGSPVGAKRFSRQQQDGIHFGLATPTELFSWRFRLARGLVSTNTLRVSRGKTAGLIGSLLVLLVGFVAALMPRTPVEPSYQGRSASSWLDNFSVRSGRSIGDAHVALKAMGPRAAPAIIRRLKASESFWQIKYRLLFSKAPARVSRFLPAPRAEFSHIDAANAFFAIGPGVKPTLIGALQTRSPEMRAAGAGALYFLGTDAGADIADAIPGLTRTLRDKNAAARMFSAFALATTGPKAQLAVPALIPLLQDPDTDPRTGARIYVRAAAVRALGRIGPKAISALPSLKPLLEDKEDYIQVAAALAIWRIGADMTNTLPVLTRGLGLVVEDAKWEVIEALGEMGPSAKTALPVLLRESALLKQSSWSWTSNCGKLTNALQQIDPETAAKAGMR